MRILIAWNKYQPSNKQLIVRYVIDYPGNDGGVSEVSRTNIYRISKGRKKYILLGKTARLLSLQYNEDK